MQFLWRESCNFKSARVNQVRFSVRIAGQGFRTCWKLDATSARQKLHRVTATKNRLGKGPLHQTKQKNCANKLFRKRSTYCKSSFKFKIRETSRVMVTFSKLDDLKKRLSIELFSHTYLFCPVECFLLRYWRSTLKKH